MKLLRGEIYEFIDKHNDTKWKKFALIISNNERQNHLMNILISKDYTKGDNMVSVNPGIGSENLNFNCSMPTYCMIEQLGDYIGTADAEDMDAVDRKIAYNLGLSRFTFAYDTLIDMMKGRKANGKEMS